MTYLHKTRNTFPETVSPVIVRMHFDFKCLQPMFFGVRDHGPYHTEKWTELLHYLPPLYARYVMEKKDEIGGFATTKVRHDICEFDANTVKRRGCKK
jgi:hypothetical protein